MHPQQHALGVIKDNGHGRLFVPYEKIGAPCEVFSSVPACVARNGKEEEKGAGDQRAFHDWSVGGFYGNCRRRGGREASGRFRGVIG